MFVTRGHKHSRIPRINCVHKFVSLRIASHACTSSFVNRRHHRSSRARASAGARVRNFPFMWWCVRACVSDPNPARPPAHPNALPVRRHFVRPPLLCQQSDIICQHRWKFAGMAVWCGNGELHKFAMTLDFAGTNQQPHHPTPSVPCRRQARALPICRRGRRRSRRRSLSLSLVLCWLEIGSTPRSTHPQQHPGRQNQHSQRPCARAAVWRRRRPPDTPEHVRTCQRPYHNNRKPPPPPRTSESIRLMRPGFE